MRRDLRAFDFSANVPWIRLVDGVIGAGMGGAGTGEDGLGFGLAIRAAKHLPHAGRPA